MKYLFASLESRSMIDVDCLPPMGLPYVASALRRSGRQVIGFKASQYENSTEALLRKIQEEHIDVLCIGELSANYPILRDTIAAVRKSCPHVKIIVGGGIITAEPEFISQHLDMDFGCVGYGEETICEFAECLETGGDFSKIKGLIYRDKTGRIVINPRRPEPENLDDIPFPALELFGFRGGNQVLRIVGSRSCTHNCTFCFHPSGYQYKARSLDSIFAEIDYWREKFEIKHIVFVDENFGGDKERVLEFCQRFKETGIKFCIYMRVDIVTEKIIEALADSGCEGIAFGIESMNQTVLDSMRKHITVEQIKNALKIARKYYKIQISGLLIFGDPAETYEIAMESLSWWLQNLHYGISLDLICAYPGTALYKYGVKTGRIKDRLKFLEARCPVTNLSAMNDALFSKLLRQINHLRKLLFEPANNLRIESGEDETALFYGACPSCETTYCMSFNEIAQNAFCSHLSEFCTACDSKIVISRQYQKHFRENRYFEEFDYEDRKIAVWGMSFNAKFRLAANKRMRESVVAVVDRNYHNFESGFLGFDVSSPETLKRIDFDVLYIGSRLWRKEILETAKCILGDSFDKKEVMLLD